MNLIGCYGVAEIYAHLEEGVGSVCHRYMCIFLDVKLIGAYVHSLICETF